jgi:hypothetical protein
LAVLDDLGSFGDFDAARAPSARSDDLCVECIDLSVISGSLPLVIF